MFIETVFEFLKTGFAMIPHIPARGTLAKVFLKITDKQGKNTAQTDAELLLPTVWLTGSANAISSKSLKTVLGKHRETSSYSAG